MIFHEIGVKFCEAAFCWLKIHKKRRADTKIFQKFSLLIDIFVILYWVEKIIFQIIISNQKNGGITKHGY